MSYTAIPTVSTGDIWSATNHNIYIKENFQAIVPDQITAKGQLMVGNSSGTMTLLTVGADNEILKSETDTLAWVTKNSIITIAGSTIAYTEIGNGNLNCDTFGITAGAKFLFGWISYSAAAASAYFRIAPSYDTTATVMRVDGNSSTFIGTCSGIIPLDSTGGFYYQITDSSDYGAIGIWGYA